MFERLSFGFGRKLPLMLQTEAAECGLACIGMVAGYYGYHTDLQLLRRRFSVSLKGATLATLIHSANQLSLATRPVKLELDDLANLKLPCILHWNFNHFVVLQKVGARSVTIHDPALGVRKLSYKEVSAAFTGVALELWPNPQFVPESHRQKIRLRQLLGRVSGLYRAFSKVLLLALSLEVFALVTPFFLQWVIDNVLVSADRDLLSLLAIGFGLVMLMQQIITLVRGWLLMVLGTTLNVQWRANSFAHLLRLPTEYFEKRHLGDIVSRFGSIDTIQRTLTTSFVEGVLDGLMAVVTLVLMFVYSPPLAWIATIAMSLYALGRWLWYRPLRTASEEQIVHAAKQQTYFLETVRGVKTIKLFQRQSERHSSWLSLLIEQINAELHTQKLGLLNQSLNGLIFGIENILVIWLGARLVIDNHFTVGVLIAFIAYKTQFDTRVGSLIDKTVELQMLQLQGERLADILLAPAEITQAHRTDGAQHNLAPSIELRNLRYRYAEQEPYVLDGLSLKIDAGESVAIIGPSGGGKTTLINILLGVLQPSAGEVLVGGLGIVTIGLDTLRQISGSVLQDDVLFAGSISDNISFFDPAPDFEWIAECAKVAAIHDDIQAMPMAYNSMVGDLGTVLSGGQKQRVLMARALYKRPSILFLDEATSHLDLQREQLVNDAISTLQITRIIVAHRPETIASADRVITLDGGIIVADEVRAADRSARLTQAPSPSMLTGRT